jgi:GGDEF domain-containing protein
LINEESDIETLINRIFEELKKPLIIDNNEIQIELSIGVSIFSDNNSDLEILIHQADSAMYVAKRRAGCTFNFFEPQTL